MLYLYLYKERCLVEMLTQRFQVQAIEFKILNSRLTQYIFPKIWVNIEDTSDLK